MSDERDGCGTYLAGAAFIVAVVVGLYLLSLVWLMFKTSGEREYARMWGEHGPGVHEQLLKEGLRPLIEFGYLVAALVGCALLGGAGRNGDPARMPGSVKGLLLGLFVVPVVAVGGFVSWMPFMQALHVAEWSALGLTGALALARVVGRGLSDY